MTVTLGLCSSSNEVQMATAIAETRKRIISAVILSELLEESSSDESGDDTRAYN